MGFRLQSGHASAKGSPSRLQELDVNTCVCMCACVRSSFPDGSEQAVDIFDSGMT